MSNKKPVIAMDLDGTLLQYDRWRGIDHFGPPIEGAREFLLAVSKFATIMIYTVRCNADVNLDRGDRSPAELRDIVANYLKSQDLYFDNIWTGQGKPLFHCTCDDRAIQCRPQENISAYSTTLLEVQRICGLVAAETNSTQNGLQKN